MTRFSFQFIAGSIIAILLASAFVVSLQAQTGSLRLEGIVWDPSGNPLPNVVLTAVEQSTGVQTETVSDPDGYYRFLVLQPGIYTVTAKVKEYKDVIHRNIFLYTPGSTSENFSFEVSAIDKEIGLSERSRLLDSDQVASFSRAEMDALPLLQRDPLRLLVFQPGVQINGGNEDASTYHGTRPTMHTIRMDGLSVTDTVNPSLGTSLLATNTDSLAELQIVSSGGNAEFGGSGGAQVQMVSRAGTKTWSGSVYDYFRDTNLNANEYFNNSYNISRPKISRHLFGAAVSGPLGGKNLLFANFEGNRTNERVVRNRQVLTSTAKTGVFQWYTPDDATRDEDTVQSFDIAANDPRHIGINPRIESLLARMPDPNNSYIGDGLNTGGYIFENPTHIHQERIQTRWDRDLNAHHRLFFRFHWDRVDATDTANSADAPFPGEPAGTLDMKNWGFMAGSDYTLSPTKVNELRIGYLKPKTDLKRPARTAAPMLQASSWTNPEDLSFPRSYGTPTFEITDNVSHALGLHTLKYGFTFRRAKLDTVSYAGSFPNITFGTDNGNVLPGSFGPSEQFEISPTDRQAFDGLANDLLGRIESINQTFYSSTTSALPAGAGRERSFASLEFAGFIQDSWRFTPKITLNFGLRYELGTAPKELNDYQTVLDPASQINSTANISNFKASPGDKWYSRSKKDFAPRVGFAWDFLGTGTLVFRGAYGMYYDRLTGAITDFVDQNSYGLSQSVTLYPNAAGTDVRLGDTYALPMHPGVPAAQPASSRDSSVALLDASLATPRIDQFSLSLQARFAGVLWEASYSGTRGTKLFQFLNLNQTKTSGDFSKAYLELKAYRDEGTPVAPTNTLIRIFGSPLEALNALGGSNFDSGQMGIAADNLDRKYYGSYAAAGVSDFYLRNFPQFNTLLFGTNPAESWHDSLQIGIRRNSAHSHFRAYYTWSKSLDTVSSDGIQEGYAWDSFNPTLDKAPSDFARTHVLNVAWDYAIPFGRDPQDDSETPKWMRAVLGGWNLGLLYTRESGARFSVNSGLQNRFAGVLSLANFSGDNREGSIFRNQGVIYWFYTDKTTLFGYPQAGETPNSGRNAFTGPMYVNMDVLLHKKFQIGEHRSVQFRAEAYNMLNSPRFALPNRDLFDPRFGQIQSTQGNPRMMQLALRYQF